MEKTRGLIAAPFTPMTEQGEINLSIIKNYTDLLLKNGIKGIFINGTTGEGLSLTNAERMSLVEAWQKHSAGKLKTFVHVAHASLKDAQELAVHAQNCGCDAIATLPPFFFKPSNVQQVVEYCREIANAAPETQFYFYHMPSMTGVNFTMIDLMEKAEMEIPTFQGIKFTYENLYDYGLCLQHNNSKYDVLYGRDEQLLAGLATGAVGAIGSFYNFLGSYVNGLVNDFNSNRLEEAQKKQQFLREFTRILINSGGGIAVLKNIMKLSGFDCGKARLPLQNLSLQQENRLREDLITIGFFEKLLN